jgi:hypothetical protein
MEECKNILNERIEDKIRKRIMNLEVMRKPVDKEKITIEVLNEVEPHLEYELDKIKQEKTKLNLREFEMIFTQLKALIESTHNRAWKGEERGSLRRHFNISEVIGGRPQTPEKKSFWSGQ